MKKILILGSSGMAGHVIFSYFTEKEKYKVYGTTNQNNFGKNSMKLNIFNINELDAILNNINPDIVINCVGMLIGSSKSNPDQTIYANSYFPYVLLKLSQSYSFKLIHISTDCVFSGKKGNYDETSIKDAVDLYGQSKALGEIIDLKNITIRTSIIGPEIKEKGEGLFHWFMTEKNDKLNGYKSNFWSGVTTLELAKFIDWVIEDHDLTGLFHLTNNIPISKFELLELFNIIYNQNKTILHEKDYVCDKSFKNTKHEINYFVPSYEEMLIEQKEFMFEHKAYYPHYEF